MTGQTIILRDGTRNRAISLVNCAPDGAVLNIRAANRSGEQNAKLWAMLSDVSRAMPQGRRHTPDVWKAIFMNACGWAVQFTEGLDGLPFPMGYRSSRLTKQQMSDLIEFIAAYGAEHGVVWSEPTD